MGFGAADVERHFGRIWPVHVERFTELLILLRKHFDGDLDRVLVLAVIGLRTLPPERVQALSYEEFEAGRLVREPSPINVHSIAETTGIPRETVRRKVSELERKGWVERLESGHLVVASKARDELAPATEATMRYLAAIGAACVAAQSSRPKAPD